MDKYLSFIALSFPFVVSLTAFAQQTMGTFSFSEEVSSSNALPYILQAPVPQMDNRPRAQEPRMKATEGVEWNDDGSLNLMACNIFLGVTESNANQSLSSSSFHITSPQSYIPKTSRNRELEGEIAWKSKKLCTNSNPSTPSSPSFIQGPVSPSHLSIFFNELDSLPSSLAPPLDDQHVLIMGSQIAQNPSLASFSFSNFKLDDNHARCILDGLLHNASSDLIHLDMSHNRITDHSILTLSKVIRHVRLESFNLSANLLGQLQSAYVAEEIIRAMQSASSIKVLDLRQNYFIDKDKERLNTFQEEGRILIEPPSFKKPLPQSFPISPNISSLNLAPNDPTNKSAPISLGTAVKYTGQDRQILRNKIENMLFTSNFPRKKGYSLRNIMDKLREEKDQKWSRIDLLPIKGLLAEMKRSGVEIEKALAPDAMEAVKKHILKQSNSTTSVTLVSEQNAVTQDWEEETE